MAGQGEAHFESRDRYEERPFVSDTRYWRERESHRFSPYQVPSRREGEGESSSGERGEEKGARRGVPENKVFVANLSYSVNWQTLKDHMKKVGEVVRCDVFKNHNGGSKGMGVVEYADSSGADCAVAELKDTLLEGRRIYVRKHMLESDRERAGISGSSRTADRPRPPLVPAATVFVGNLDFSVTWQKLKDCFKVAGKVVFCEIQTSKDGKSRGMGTVQYEKSSDALNAIALFHGQMLFNRPMTVRMDNRSPVRPDPMQVKMMYGGGLNNIALSNQTHYGTVDAGMGLGMSDSTGMSHHHASGMGMSSGHLQPDGPPHHHHHHTAPPPPPPDSRYEFGDRAPTNLGHTGHSGQAHQMSSPYPHVSSARGRRVLVRNLNFRTPWQKLKDTFCQAGLVEFVDMMKNQDGRPNGRAYILFRTPEGADTAIRLFNNAEMDGRKVEVTIDRSA